MAGPLDVAVRVGADIHEAVAGLGQVDAAVRQSAQIAVEANARQAQAVDSLTAKVRASEQEQTASKQRLAQLAEKEVAAKQKLVRAEERLRQGQVRGGGGVTRARNELRQIQAKIKAEADLGKAVGARVQAERSALRDLRAAEADAAAQKRRTEAASSEAQRALTREAQAKRNSARAADGMAAADTRAAAAKRGLGAASAVAGRRMGRNNAIIQNTAFQVQDFAVQVAMGTNAMRAMGQQAPQLLGAFGAMGAVAGAVIAIALPLAGALFNIGAGAEAAADPMGDLADALDRFTDANGILNNAERLANEAGRYADELERALRAKAGLATADFLSSAQEAAESTVPGPRWWGTRWLLGETLGGNLEAARPAIQSGREAPPLIGRGARRGVSEADREKLRTYTAELTESYRALRLALDGIKKQFGLIYDDQTLLTGQAREFADLWTTLTDDNATPDSIIAASNAMTALLTKAKENENLTEDQKNNIDATIALMADLTTQAIAFKNATNGAVSVAKALADELERAADALDRLIRNAEFDLQRAQARLQFRNDPEALNNRLRQIFINEQVDPEQQARDAAAQKLRAKGMSTREVARVLAPQDAQLAENRAKAGALYDTQKQTDDADQARRDAENRERQAAAEADRKARERARKLAEEKQHEIDMLNRTRDAILAYGQDAQDMGDEVAAAWARGFKGMEDAIVQFVMTGKASVKDLANAIIADLARIAIRRAITGPLATAFGNAFFPGSGAGAAGAGQAPTTAHSGAVIPGVRGTEVPAVLLAGEAVLTPGQARAVLGYGANAAERERALRILRSASRYHAGGVAGQAAAAGQGGQGGGMRIEIMNRGQAKQVQGADIHIDVRGMVVSLVLDDISTGGPIARGIQGMVL